MNYPVVKVNSLGREIYICIWINNLFSLKIKVISLFACIRDFFLTFFLKRRFPSRFDHRGATLWIWSSSFSENIIFSFFGWIKNEKSWFDKFISFLFQKRRSCQKIFCGNYMDVISSFTSSAICTVHSHTW